MRVETKEAVAFMAGSLYNLAEMVESDLPEVVKLVGVNAIRDLMSMDHLRVELNHEQMADEICNYIGWDPMLAIPPWTDEELSKIGRQIAGLVEDENPSDRDATENLFAVLCWGGLKAWL